jgi:hypothetical protein
LCSGVALPIFQNRGYVFSVHGVWDGVGPHQERKKLSLAEESCMKTLVIALGFIMLLSGTGFADEAHGWKYTRRDGTTVSPPQKTYQNYTRNTNTHAKDTTAGPHKQEQKRKGPDPYDPRYNSNYRPRF